MERWGGRHNNEQSCQRQRKPAVKMEKPENVLRSKTTNRQTTFKITIRSDCWCLCIQASVKKKKPRFQHCVWQFGWTTTSLFEIWTPAGSSDITSLIYKGIFFFSLQNGTLSFYFGPFFFLFSFLFFYQGVFSALDFSVSKDFSTSKELLRVTFLKCAM